MSVSARKAGAVVRSFVAIELPEDVRVACVELATELGRAPGGDGVRWTRPEGYHLTLRFLGNVEVERLPELAKLVGEAVATQGAFAFRLAAVRGFPTPRRPRIVAALAEPALPLVELAERVEAGVVAAGLPAESRKFRPHLTLGRVRNRRLPALEGVALPGPSEVPVREVVLFRSDLGRDGAVYTVLERIALGAA